MEEETEASVVGLSRTGKVGCWQEEGREVWLRTGASPQIAAERFPVC